MTLPDFPWGHARRYNDYSSYIKRKFNERIQKISLDAGFTCPNRDGKKATGGCIFCNNDTFNPNYSQPYKPIAEQMEHGIAFFAPKYQAQKYIAYFQAYTNTYAPLAHLKRLYEEALSVSNVIGIAIGTRPDCLPDDVIDYISTISKEKYVTVEIGIESTINSTLETINRGHTFEEAVDAINRCQGKGFYIGTHLILGLPGETPEDIIHHAQTISKLPVDYLKIHQLQIVKDSALGAQYLENPEQFKLFTADEYLDVVVDFLEHLNPRIVVERFISQSPAELLIAPKWGIKNFEFVAKVERRLKERDSWQGEKMVVD